MRDEEALLRRRLEALGLRGVTGIRATDNRCVMVSLTRGRALCIHRGYAMAPDRVLKAVVRFLAPRARRALRKAAEHEILSFTPEAHVEGLPRRRRAADRPQPGDLARIERLSRLFGELNARWFGGSLPELPIRVSGRMRTRLGQLCLRLGTGEPFEITMSRRHIDRDGWDEAAHTLLHEMVHLWQHVTGRGVDHGPGFRRTAREVGVSASARRSVGPTRSRRAARTD